LKGMPVHAEQLISLILDLDIETGMERSFKVAEQKLLQNRFIIGFKKGWIPVDAEERIIGICKKIHMPEQLLNAFREHLPEAGYIHFGFEESESSCIYKVYLEFWEKAQEAIDNQQVGAKGFVLHRGFKWDISDATRQAITRYAWHPWLSSGEIEKRVGQVIDPHTGTFLRQAAHDLVRIAAVRIPDKDILYLDVAEDGNPRRSFDINVYRANLQVAEVYPLLSVLCRRLSVPYDAFHTFYEGSKTKRLGHLAAGVDRRGSPFFTIYYGVEPLSAESPLRAGAEAEKVVRPSRYTMPPRRKRLVRVEETDNHAGRLYRLVEGLGFHAAVERSFKFMDRILLAGRFLMGFRRRTSLSGQDEAIMNLCRQIAMPEDHQEKFRAELAGADIVLFGYEANEKNRVYKVYLEFDARLAEAARQTSPPEKVHIHTGFKWDVTDNSRKSVAIYNALPIFRAEEIAKRVAAGFYADKKDGIHRQVDDILDLAGSRTQPGELLYFEVSEGNNLRVSYDINVYKAGLQMAEFYPQLIEIARHYNERMDIFDELYEAVKSYKLGHLSGGTDREGRDFLTLYFAERRGPNRDRSRYSNNQEQATRHDHP